MKMSNTDSAKELRPECFVMSIMSNCEGTVLCITQILSLFCTVVLCTILVIVFTTLNYHKPIIGSKFHKLSTVTRDSQTYYDDSSFLHVFTLNCTKFWADLLKIVLAIRKTKIKNGTK
jgi:hypothetical protein